MSTETQIQQWLKIGLRNPFINAQNNDIDCLSFRDPVFDEKMFCECKTIDELIEKLNYGNWCLGQAFYYKNICFINQVNGGDEFLVIKNNISFESISYYDYWENGVHHYEGYSRPEFREFIDRVMKATDEQLLSLQY